VGAYFGEAYYKTAYADSTMPLTKDTVINGRTVKNGDTTSYKNKFRTTHNHTYGLYAPIGVAFNMGSHCKSNINSSFSLFVQLIDLGALVNFYLTHGDSTSMPSNVKIRLIDIFAPGLQFAYGIPKVPLSIAGGAQIIPIMNQLSDLGTPNQAVAPTWAWRAHISLVVDIPMFNVKVWDYKKRNIKNTYINN
jgi:hypothetical protein